MISLRQLLIEAEAILEKDAEQLLASKVAKKLGLIYKGFGRWADPQTNKIVAKTIDGKLVKVTPEDEADGEKGYDKGSKHSTGRSMKRMAGSLDAPSGLPFQQKKGPKPYAKTNAKVLQTLAKNKDRIENDDELFGKAINLVKKMNITAGLDPADAEYMHMIAADGGIDELLRADQFVGEALTDNGTFAVEYDYLVSPANYNHPDEYDSKTMEFDSLEDVWSQITWRKDKNTGKQDWSFEPDVDDGGGRYDTEYERDNDY